MKVLSRNHARIVRNRVVHVWRGLRHVASSAFIHPSARVSPDLVAGDYAFVGPRCKIDPGVRLGRYAMLAAEVAVVGDDHVWDVPGVPMQFTGRPRQRRTEIGDDVWVGYGALVMRGVRVGRGAVVAARAVVTRDVEPFSIVAGVPARRIGERFVDPEARARHEEMLNGPLAEPVFAPKLTSGEEL